MAKAASVSLEMELAYHKGTEYLDCTPDCQHGQSLRSELNIKTVELCGLVYEGKYGSSAEGGLERSNVY